MLAAYLLDHGCGFALGAAPAGLWSGAGSRGGGEDDCRGRLIARGFAGAAPGGRAAALRSDI